MFEKNDFEPELEQKFTVLVSFTSKVRQTMDTTVTVEYEINYLYLDSFSNYLRRILNNSQEKYLTIGLILFTLIILTILLTFSLLICWVKILNNQIIRDHRKTVNELRERRRRSLQFIRSNWMHEFEQKSRHTDFNHFKISSGTSWCKQPKSPYCRRKSIANRVKLVYGERSPKKVEWNG